MSKKEPNGGVVLKLEEAIQEAQRYGDEMPAPPNEANTCDWVIRPLLVAAGYSNHEILAQTSDPTKKIPDYTLLPSSDHTWFLEAKAWAVALESLHVDQSLNYAHSNGRQWVVLTNGKEWRLYDDHIKGVSSDRLVVTASLQDTANMIRFLSALSRETVISQKVIEYASEKRLREYLATTVGDPTSAVVQAIVQIARKQLQNVRVEPHVVSEILSRIQSLPVASSATPALVQKTPPTFPVILPSPPSAIESSSEPVFRISNKGIEASAQKGSGKTMVVLAGSEFSKLAAPSYAEVHGHGIARLLNEGSIIDAGDRYRATKDIAFKTPSAASDMILGSSSNGWDYWKDDQSRTLHEVYRASNKT